MSITMKIEIPVGSSIIYEIDKDTGEMRVERVSNLSYPCTYGYIKDTLADDGDALDVFLLGHEIYVPGSILDIELIGMIEMKDDGELDNKIIAKPVWAEFGDEFINRTAANIVSFLKQYKDGTEVGSFMGRVNAEECLERCKNVVDSYQYPK